MTVGDGKGLTDGALELRGPGYTLGFAVLVPAASAWDRVVEAEAKWSEVVPTTFLATLLSLLAVLTFSDVRQWRKPACLVRLDVSGITVYGHALVPWAEVAEVRTDRGNSVLFVAPAGQDLPLFPRPGRHNPRDAANTRLAKGYGRTLVITSTQVNASRRKILAAVRELTAGAVPVTEV